MTIAEEILDLLRKHPEGLTDADLARRTGKVHQQINQRCRDLASQGLLIRDPALGVIRNRLTRVGDKPSSDRANPETADRLEMPHADREWFWEGNIQAFLCTWLARQGWSLVQVMNTASKQQGTDVEAQRGTVRLHIEVKGYPSKSYADQRRSGEVKRTQPTLQAKHWYADALLKVLRLREKYPNDAIAMAFPAQDRYRTLLHDTGSTLRVMRIQAFLVAEDGVVVEWGTDNDKAS